MQARFGGRLKAMVSGGAPLNPDVGLFFHALGLPVLQGYGQTEAAPVISVNLPGQAKLHRRAAAHRRRRKIAPDGEILVRGDLVMRGYWNDEAATAQALRDGWLHTGDIGEIDPDGCIRITDRKKDIIVARAATTSRPRGSRASCCSSPRSGRPWSTATGGLVALVVPHRDFVRGFARGHGRAPDLAALAEDRASRPRSARPSPVPTSACPRSSGSAASTSCPSRSASRTG